MNRGIYCAVGVATGVFLLGGGVAQAAPVAHEADRTVDPEATSVLFTDIHAPAGGQHRDVASISAGLGRTENQPAPADRTELLDGLGGAKLGGVDLLGTLLNGITTGGLLGSLTGGGGGPLGALLGGGPLGALTGGAKQAPASTADGADASGTATVNAPASRAQASGQTGPAMGANMSSTESSTESGTSTVREEAAGDLLGPNGPLGQIEILGGDTLAGLPVAGDLLAGGISLGTIDNIPTVTEVVDQIRGEDAGKSSLGIPTLGGLSRMLLGGAETEAQTEAQTEAGERVAEHRILTQPTIDKARVTPQLQPLSGIVHQLPLAG